MRKRTFDELVTQVGRAASLGFDTLTDYQLLVASLVCEFGLYQLSMRILVQLGRLLYDTKILLPNGRPWIEPSQRLKDAEVIFDYTRAKNQAVRQDYERYPDHDLFLAYIELRRAIDEMRHEIHRRMTKNKAAALLRFGDLYPKQEQFVADLKKAIKVDRLRSKRPRKYDDEELQAMAIEKAVSLLRDQEVRAIQDTLEARERGNLPFQPFLQPRNITEAFWMSEFERGWWPKFSTGDLTKRLSVLTTDSVPEKVRQYLRDFYQQWETKNEPERR